MSTPRPGAMPPTEDVQVLAGIDIVLTDDGFGDYVRGRFRDTGCGVVYASHVPLPWAVYWTGHPHEDGMAWCKTLRTALALLERVTR